MLAETLLLSGSHNALTCLDSGKLLHGRSPGVPQSEMGLTFKDADKNWGYSTCPACVRPWVQALRTLGNCEQ